MIIVSIFLSGIVVTLYIFPLTIVKTSKEEPGIGYVYVLLGGIAILFIILTLSMAGFLKFAYKNVIRVREGDTVLLSRLKPSDYSEVMLEEVLQAGDSNHVIDALLVPCKVLKSHFTSIHIRSRNLTLTSPTREFGEQPAYTPIYLLAGSNVTYSFRIWSTMYQLKPPEIVIFDNYESYLAFISGENDESHAIFRQRLQVGRNNPEVIKISFQASTDSYYFITGYSEAGITYQFNATDNALYLNETDYINEFTVCRFSVGVSCSFQTNGTFLGSNTDNMCLIAHIVKPPSQDPPSTHIVLTTKTCYDGLTILLATVSIIIVISLLLFVLLAHIVKHYKY